jgi:hypothetical protein
MARFASDERWQCLLRQPPPWLQQLRFRLKRYNNNVWKKFTTTAQEQGYINSLQDQPLQLVTATAKAD